VTPCTDGKVAADKSSVSNQTQAWNLLELGLLGSFSCWRAQTNRFSRFKLRFICSLSLASWPFDAILIKVTDPWFTFVWEKLQTDRCFHLSRWDKLDVFESESAALIHITNKWSVFTKFISWFEFKPHTFGNSCSVGFSLSSEFTEKMSSYSKGAIFEVTLLLLQISMNVIVLRLHHVFLLFHCFCQLS